MKKLLILLSVLVLFGVLVVNASTQPKEQQHERFTKAEKKILTKALKERDKLLKYQKKFEIHDSILMYYYVREVDSFTYITMVKSGLPLSTSVMDSITGDYHVTIRDVFDQVTTKQAFPVTTETINNWIGWLREELEK